MYWQQITRIMQFSGHVIKVGVPITVKVALLHILVILSCRILFTYFLYITENLLITSRNLSIGNEAMETIKTTLNLQGITTTPLIKVDTSGCKSM